MKPWPADFSACAVEEIITLRTTNRAWYNELERNMRDLMNRKLAKQIDSEEYSAQRRCWVRLQFCPRSRIGAAF